VNAQLVPDRRDAGQGPPDDELEVAHARHEIEAGLVSIDFAEVTCEDRVTFVEHVATWQAKCALRAGRLDLALAVLRDARVRIAGIEREALVVPRRAGARRATAPVRSMLEAR
jgi:hypothetical protein